MEDIVRKGEIACNKQFLLFSQCFLPNMELIFHFKCTLKCCLQFVSIWASLKFFHLVKGFNKQRCAYNILTQFYGKELLIALVPRDDRAISA